MKTRLERKQRIGGEHEAKMITLADPSLEIQKVGRLALEEFAAAFAELPTILVGDREG